MEEKLAAEDKGRRGWGNNKKRNTEALRTSLNKSGNQSLRRVCWAACFRLPAAVLSLPTPL